MTRGLQVAPTLAPGSPHVSHAFLHFTPRTEEGKYRDDDEPIAHLGVLTYGASTEEEPLVAVEHARVRQVVAMHNELLRGEDDANAFVPRVDLGRGDDVHEDSYVDEVEEPLPRLMHSAAWLRADETRTMRREMAADAQAEFDAGVRVDASLVPTPIIFRLRTMAEDLPVLPDPGSDYITAVVATLNAAHPRERAIADLRREERVRERAVADEALRTARAERARVRAIARAAEVELGRDAETTLRRIEQQSVAVLRRYLLVPEAVGEPPEHVYGSTSDYYDAMNAQDRAYCAFRDHVTRPRGTEDDASVERRTLELGAAVVAAEAERQRLYLAVMGPYATFDTPESQVEVIELTSDPAPDSWVYRLARVREDLRQRAANTVARDERLRAAYAERSRESAWDERERQARTLEDSQAWTAERRAIRHQRREEAERAVAEAAAEALRSANSDRLNAEYYQASNDLQDAQQNQRNDRRNGAGEEAEERNRAEIQRGITRLAQSEIEIFGYRVSNWRVVNYTDDVLLLGERVTQPDPVATPERVTLPEPAVTQEYSPQLSTPRAIYTPRTYDSRPSVYEGGTPVQQQDVSADLPMHTPDSASFDSPTPVLPHSPLTVELRSSGFDYRYAIDHVEVNFDAGLMDPVGLRVAPSCYRGLLDNEIVDNMGDALIACKPISAGTLIATFQGTRISQRDARALPRGDGRYLVDMQDGSVLNCMDDAMTRPPRCLASLANQADHAWDPVAERFLTYDDNNAYVEWYLVDDSMVATLYAVRLIDREEEVMWAYGPNFERGFGDHSFNSSSGGEELSFESEGTDGSRALSPDSRAAEQPLGPGRRLRTVVQRLRMAGFKRPTDGVDDVEDAWPEWGFDNEGSFTEDESTVDEQQPLSPLTNTGPAQREPRRRIAPTRVPTPPLPSDAGGDAKMGPG